MSWKPAQAPSRIPKWVPVKLRGCFKVLLMLPLLAMLVLLSVGLYYHYLSIQYDLDDVTKIPERSIVYDRSGKEYTAVHGERRRLISREEIPDTLVHALYAREDANFPRHHGVDVRGLARATLRNIKDGKFTQGASTLTMQLTRNTYELRAKSLHRKFLEIALTLRLERRYSKDEILTHYLNRIYFGAGCHGVEQAAQTYFGRPAAELNTAECAMIVGIIRGPHVFSPFRNLERAQDQQDDVYARMVAAGSLTEVSVEEARLQPLRLVPKEDRGSSVSYAHMSIRYQLYNILADHNIRDGGLKIYTTIDSVAQSRCEELLRESITPIEDGADAESENEVQAAVVSISPQTGAVLAICGGRDVGESTFNRVYRSKRDLGNAFRPFLHALALERNKVAIVDSSVQTGRQLGVDETMRLCRRIGFSGPFAKTEDLYRGSLAVSPMELAMAGAILKDGGKKHEPYFIEKITDLHGRTLYEHRINPSPSLSPHAGEDALGKYKEISSEYGYISSTSAARDGWGVRILNDSVTVVWLGYDKPKKMGEREDVIESIRRLMAKF